MTTCKHCGEKAEPCPRCETPAPLTDLDSEWHTGRCPVCYTFVNHLCPVLATEPTWRRAIRAAWASERENFEWVWTLSAILTLLTLVGLAWYWGTCPTSLISVWFWVECAP